MLVRFAETGAVEESVQVEAEVGPILDRVDNAEQAATECGAAPVTKSSGEITGVYFRWAANTRARKPGHQPPPTSIQQQQTLT